MRDDSPYVGSSKINGLVRRFGSHLRGLGYEHRRQSLPLVW